MTPSRVFSCPAWLRFLPCLVLMAGCGEPEPATFEERLDAAMKDFMAARAEAPPGNAPALAAELAVFDTLAREQAAEAPERAALALRQKAAAQLFYLEDRRAARETLEAVVARFPGTGEADRAEAMLASLRIQAGLRPGAWFPDFTAPTLGGERFTLSDLRGRVVLVDFWATWCPPCRAELPQVKAAYEAYRDAGFEVVAISLDKDRDTLARFVDREDLPWVHVFDGQEWDSPLVARFGVMSIPTAYLLDPAGRIVATDLSGGALADRLEALLGGGNKN